MELLLSLFCPLSGMLVLLRGYRHFAAETPIVPSSTEEASVKDSMGLRLEENRQQFLDSTALAIIEFRSILTEPEFEAMSSGLFDLIVGFTEADYRRVDSGSAKLLADLKQFRDRDGKLDEWAESHVTDIQRFRSLSGFDENSRDGRHSPRG